VRRGTLLAIITFACARLSYGAPPPPQVPPRPTRSPATGAAKASFDRLAGEAAAAHKAGRLEEAAELYGKALARRPSWTEGRWARATLLYDLDRFQEAREEFRRVVAARPADGVALALRALCDVSLGDYDAALEGLKAARALGVATPGVRSVAAFQLALLVNRAGEHEAALEMLRGLAEQGRDTPAVIEAFGLITLRLTLMPAEVAPTKRDMLVLAGRGGFHMARGRRTQVGRIALEELVSRFPNEPNVHYAYGLYVAPDEPDLAIAEWRRELTRDPAHYAAMLQIASLLLSKGDAAEAVALADQAATIAPTVPAAFLVLGRALLETGDAERAVRTLERGAALAPESADLQFALARGYQRVGRAEDAERARQTFVRLDGLARERKPEAVPADASPTPPSR
jgi:tetratricopeptide (TPR) repeat protein